jgi:hypothetical protein
MKERKTKKKDSNSQTNIKNKDSIPKIIEPKQNEPHPNDHSKYNEI